MDCYDATAAALYDAMELDTCGNSPVGNFVLDELGARQPTRTVLDMTCGTGAQALALAAAGHAVTASDLSPDMLSIARRKAQQGGQNIAFHHADMRSVSLGTFDAIISMYNAIGHLDAQGLFRTLCNARANLRGAGVYLFDIFDRERLCHLPQHCMLDTATERDGVLYARLTRNTVEAASGRVRIQQTTYIQQELQAVQKVEHDFTLQTWSAAELQALLGSAGFEHVHIRHGSEVVPTHRLAPLMLFVSAGVGAHAQEHPQ